MGVSLENLLAGALYLPFLLMPFAMLFWYAVAAARHPEAASIRGEQTQRQTGKLAR